MYCTIQINYQSISNQCDWKDTKIKRKQETKSHVREKMIGNGEGFIVVSVGSTANVKTPALGSVEQLTTS